MSNDYYTILGIPKTASSEEVKKAYRKLAHQHHPDKQSGDEKKFKEINEAYQILSDPNKRAQYDQFGPSFEQGGQGFGGFGPGGFDGFDFSKGFGGFRQGGQEFDMEDIFDLFGSAFGGFGRSGSTGRSRERVSGEDIKINLTLTLREVARGVTEKVELARDVICEVCGGSGANPPAGEGSGLIDCSVCDGKGEVRENSTSLFGNITRVYACGVCRGKGQMPKNNCHNCKGEGKKRSRENIEVNIPAGIKNGEVLLVRGKGQAGFRGQKSGDLYIQIKVEPDKRFQRVGNDVTCEIPIKLTDAMLGARISVPTFDGEKEIEIPAGIQNGEELKLNGLGVWGRPRGDQIIKIKIDIPKKISGKARKIVEELSHEV